MIANEDTSILQKSIYIRSVYYAILKHSDYNIKNIKLGFNQGIINIERYFQILKKITLENIHIIFVSCFCTLVYIFM